MISLLLCSLDILLIGILTIPAYPFTLLTSLFSKPFSEKFTLGFIRFSMKSLLFCGGVKVTYKGLANLPAEGESVVYVGNHRSFFDVIATYAAMSYPTGFIAKKEMKRWPMISWWMILGHCLFLDRNDHQQGITTLLKGIKLVEKGISMVIYPEGHRSRTEGQVGHFHKGSFVLPLRPRAAIIPVSYSGSGAIFEDHLPWVHPGKMIVEFSAPVRTEHLTSEESEKLPEQIRNIVSEKHVANSKELGLL